MRGRSSDGKQADYADANRRSHTNQYQKCNRCNTQQYNFLMDEEEARGLPIASRAVIVGREIGVIVLKSQDQGG